MTFCPGKYQPHAVSGPWDRDLETDLDAVRDWGASLVITLLEDHELRELRVPALGEEIERRAMGWVQVPIPDGGAPDGRPRAYWWLATVLARNALLRRDTPGHLVPCIPQY